MTTHESLPRVALITCAAVDEARRIARKLLEAKTAACVNIVGQIESHYWWEEKLESAEECLLIVKTTEDKTDQLQQIVKEMHSYDLPEIIFLPIVHAEADYLAWLRRAVLAVVCALGMVVTAGAADFESLNKQLGHPDDEKRADAADGLTELGGPKVETLFQGMLSSTNPERRQLAAVGLLQVRNTGENVDRVRNLLDDDVSIVRWSAVLALGECGHAKCLPWLRAAAVNDSAASVREAAREAVAKLEALIPWRRSLHEAEKQAQELNKPLMIYFNLPRSPYCRTFEQGVLRAPEVVDAAQSFVPVWIDAAQQTNIVEKLDVRGSPTVILLNSQGSELARIAGLVGKTEFLERLEEARRSRLTFRQARRTAGRDPTNIEANWKVASSYLSDGREELAEPYLRNVITHDEQNDYGHTDNAIFALGFLLGRKAEYGQAIFCFESLLERWPQFADRDKVLYCLGLSQIAMGQKEKGMGTLMRLQQEFAGTKTSAAAQQAINQMDSNNDE